MSITKPPLRTTMAANGHRTHDATVPHHQRMEPVPKLADPMGLAAALRRAPALPNRRLTDPQVTALADEARKVLNRGSDDASGVRELSVRALPGADGRVLLFSDNRGRSVALPEPPIERTAHVLSDLHLLVGVGAGYRLVPGLLSTGAMLSFRKEPGEGGLDRFVKAGASSVVGGAAQVWDVTKDPVSLGLAKEISLPFVSVGENPVLGEVIEFSIPGLLSVLAAVKEVPGKEDVGWLVVVWHQGIGTEGPHAAGPTVNMKALIGHPALAAPLSPVVEGAAKVMNPLSARLEAMTSRSRREQPLPDSADGE
ncbi:MAG: hypothetical protein ACO3JL_13030 [Myxococcota bacterium]